MIDGFPLF